MAGFRAIRLCWEKSRPAALNDRYLHDRRMTGGFDFEFLGVWGGAAYERNWELCFVSSLQPAGASGSHRKLNIMRSQTPPVLSFGRVRDSRIRFQIASYRDIVLPSGALAGLSAYRAPWPWRRTPNILRFSIAK